MMLRMAYADIMYMMRVMDYAVDGNYAVPIPNLKEIYHVDQARSN